MFKHFQVICFVLSSVMLLLPIMANSAEPEFQQTIKIETGEKWWGGAIVDGPVMPFGDEPYSLDLLGENKGNQCQPLLVSSHGRYVWCEDPLAFEFKDGTLTAESSFSEIKTGKAGSSLKDAFLYASQTFFPPSGTLPAELLFTRPQYNTWIELMYDQNEKDILQYARDIEANGFPSGVLMIDDNWQEDYGTLEFKAERFGNPKGMVRTLHDMGFKIMLWVCPFISPDSPVYRELARKHVLISEDENQARPAMIRWWNGVSALVDLSNPDGEKWFIGQLKHLVDKYGIDGFKLDAGDAPFYAGEVHSYEEIHPNRHMELFARIGLHFPMNEYRACWKMAGQPLVQRLRDKAHNWEDLQKLIPGILAQGLAGYAYTCPDLIGGGEFLSFLNLDSVDQELIVRSAQCHALMPMMQFSVAPWRVLDKDKLAVCKDMAELHVRFAEEIMDLARHSSKTGEPIARHMEYVFPHQGYINVSDQFMLGNDILVAPVLKKETYKRSVLIPEGTWKGDDRSIVKGPRRIEIDVPLDRLPWYRRVE